MARYLGISLFIGGKKLTNNQTVDIDQTSNAEEVITDKKEPDYTSGRPTTKISLKGAVPVTGIDVDIQGKYERQELFELAASPVNGQIYTWKDARCTSLKWAGDVQKGTQTFDAEFGAGLPKRTG